MKFISLSSGSSGNSTLIEHQGHYILIDIGITYKDFIAKIESLNIPLEKIEAVLITHKHIDHLRSIKYFKDEIRYSLCTVTSLPSSNYLTPYKEREISVFNILPLAASHDTDALNFVIKAGDEELAYITDTGYISKRNLAYINNKDYYFFESNHDVKMLMASDRPYFLKQRILSDNGHLSNESASEYLMQLIGEKTKEIMLIHLSDVANTPALALDTLKEIAIKRKKDLSSITISCANRFELSIGGNRG